MLISISQCEVQIWTLKISLISPFAGGSLPKANSPELRNIIQETGLYHDSDLTHCKAKHM